MIIVGYPGIGKTSIIDREKGIIDLESYFFHNPLDTLNGSDYGWERRYCDVAIDLHQQGYTVCVSSHEAVQIYLKDHQEKHLGFVALVYPAPTDEMREKWIKRLRDRYYESRRADASPHWCIDKNYRALQRAEECYALDTMIMSQSPLFKYEITDIPYDLNDVVTACKDELNKRWREGGYQ